MAGEYEKRLEESRLWDFAASQFPTVAPAAIIQRYKALGIPEPWKDKFLGWAIEGYFGAQNAQLMGKDIPPGFMEPYSILTNVMLEGSQKYQEEFESVKIKNLSRKFFEGIELPDNFKKFVKKYGEKTLAEIGIKRGEFKKGDEEKLRKKLEDPKVAEEQGFKDLVYNTLVEIKVKQDYLPEMLGVFKSFAEYNSKIIKETAKSKIESMAGGLEKRIEGMKEAKKKKD